MKQYGHHSKPLLFALLSLLIGTVNYWLFQPHILVFAWMGKASPGPLITLHPGIIKVIVTGYVADMAWCTALCFVVLFFNNLKYLNTAGKIIILTVPYLSEIIQKIGILQGTFDWIDILLYTMIIFVFALFSTLFKTPPS
ncbi:MAG: hypothetical protein KGO81_06375 [Bacteroidota bacterium]|nr:hypothetical protein [Bacteroidota bacterium]